MRLVARRDLQGAGSTSMKSCAANQRAERGGDPRPRQQKRPAVGMAPGPPGRWRQRQSPPQAEGRTGKTGIARQNRYGAPPICAPAPRNARSRHRESHRQPLRKGNVVEVDGKLYVVLTAENFHPGKGTPTTQIDMRRISDGVKTSERYKTTEQVERAFVEDHDYSYLYQDGDGFIFMNQENYEQVAGAGTTSSATTRPTCRKT